MYTACKLGGGKYFQSLATSLNFGKLGWETWASELFLKRRKVQNKMLFEYEKIKELQKKNLNGTSKLV